MTFCSQAAQSQAQNMFVTLWVRFDMVKEGIGFYGEYQGCINLCVGNCGPIIHPFYCCTKIVSKMSLVCPVLVRLWGCFWVSMRAIVGGVLCSIFVSYCGLK